MKKIVVDYTSKALILSSSFMKKASIFNTAEFDELQEVRRNHPDFTITVRQFKKNTAQDHYKGLTYDKMRERIIAIEGENAPAVLKEFEDLIDISKCHSNGKRYPVIKSWFLNRYSDIAKFGLTDEQYEAKKAAAAARVKLKTIKAKKDAAKVVAMAKAAA